MIFLVGLLILARVYFVRARWQKFKGVIKDYPGEYIVVEYIVDGTTYETKISGAAGDVGDDYAIYVNPKSPGKAEDAGVLLPLFGVLFTLVGGAGSWHFLTGGTGG